MKKLLSLGLIALLSGCSTVSANQVANQNVTKLSEVSALKLLENNSDQKQQVFIAEVSKEKGASFSINIDMKSGFNVKDNTNGIAEKTTANINKVDVYLLKLPSTFAAGGDPLGASDVNVVKSFTGVNALSKTGNNFTVTFQNVPGLANDQYWVGIIAKDSSDNIINKSPSTAWTGNTLTNAPALRLSSNGVGVDTTTLAVTNTNSLTLALPLLDAVGAKIEAGVSSTSGNSPTSISISATLF
ncbi:hypothetical protein EON78_00665 [bacterium]|nr:MAG: hypothetical protein EON78_00665 [bacterium]